MDNVLSNQAIRELKKLYSDVTTLKNKINRITGTGPRLGNQIYARLGTYDETAQAYDGTQVLFDGNGPTEWSDRPNPRTWGGDATDIGWLYAIDSTGSTLSGVHPVFPLSDGTARYWGFIVAAKEMTDTLSGMIEQPAAKTYILDLDVYTDGTIDEFTTQTEDDTCSVNVRINSTPVSFGVSPTFDTTEATFDATDNNVFEEGDKIDVVLSSIGDDCTDASFSLRFTRAI